MQEFRYKAFISYSHSDEKWAIWLHRALEAYKPPRHLVGQRTATGTVPQRFAPVFRDRDELPSAMELGAVINEALDKSAAQIVICSPAAARSKWVNEEILAYKRLGREGRIFCLIVDGEPNASDIPGREDEECFPEALRYRLNADGELSSERSEPVGADARANKDGKSNAKLKLLAGMLGVGFDALRQRELHRRQRRMAAIATASVAGMVVTTGLSIAALYQRSEAIEARAQAEIEAEKANRTVDFLVELFEQSDPSQSLGEQITVGEILRQAAARIERELADQPEIQATMMATIGTVYGSLGSLTKGKPLLESSLEKREQLFGEQNLEVADSMQRLAYVLKLQASYEDSESLYRRALDIRRALLGEENLDVASVLYDLADLLGRTGELEAAEPLFRRSLEMRQRLLGERSPEVAQSLEGLALNLFDQGDFETPVGMLRTAVAMRRELQGPIHPDLAESVNQLAYVLGAVGDYVESEDLFREALDMKYVLYDEPHPEIALGLNNVGGALWDQGKYDEAEAMFREALAMQLEVLGPDHDEVALTLNNLAFLLHEKGDLKGALEMSEKSLETFRRALGDEHRDVASVMANRGIWLIEAGDYEEAEQVLRDSLDMRRRLLGNTHADVASSLTLLATLYVETGDFGKAQLLGSEARILGTDSLSADHWRTAAAASTEGAALAGLHQFEAAQTLLLDSYAILEGDPGALPFYIRNARKWLADLYTLWGRPDDARKYLDLPADSEIAAARTPAD